MDQIFDRLGDLLKSWVNPGTDSGQSHFNTNRRFADPLMDEAMEELDAFLDDDREKQARLAREREARARAEEAARARPKPSGPPAKLLAAYKTLGLSYGASFEQVRANYKNLLKEHHPDRHGSSPEALKKATETSARINNAYRIIETWKEKGSLGDE